MARQAVISLPDDVYEELRRRAGQGDVSGYIEQLIRPGPGSNQALEAGYRAMAADQEGEREAFEWIGAEPDDALP